MRLVLSAIVFSLLLISCGQRKEKEKELVYNDPRTEECGKEICYCQPNQCGQCPRGSLISIVNKNTCEQQNSCEKPKLKTDDENRTPIIIVQQSQDQDQNQTGTNTNDVSNTNDNSKPFTAVINYKEYTCYRTNTCNKYGMSCGSSAQTVTPSDFGAKTITDHNGEEATCYPNRR